MLFDGAGDWTYAVFRTSVLRKTPLHASYHGGDRTLMAELALHGTLYQVPDWLYFRRDHPNRHLSPRERSTIFDPRRASRQTRPPAFTRSTSGDTSRPSGALRCRARKNATATVHMARWLPSRAAPVQEGEEEVSFGTHAARLRSCGGCPACSACARRRAAPQQTDFEVPDININAHVPGKEADGIVTKRAPRVGLFGLLGNGQPRQRGLHGGRAPLPEELASRRRRGRDVHRAGNVRRRYGIPARTMTWVQRYEKIEPRAPMSLLKMLGKGIDVVRVGAWAAQHDVVIIPGMGTMEASLPLRPWGLPYSFFLLCLAGKLAWDEGSFR